MTVKEAEESQSQTQSETQTIDFSKITLQRGTTPQDIEQKCFDLCRNYLGGVWLKLTIDEVEVKRLSGGLTNQLYYCGINEDKRSDAKEPQEVAIRLYEDKHFNNSENETNKRLTDTIIALMVSQNGLGPKIYGLFESGQIMRYYKVFQLILISIVLKLFSKSTRILELKSKKTHN